ncbi:hypothetical protein TSUD_239140 [Trifolium subterraneum]|uniref:Uncharacterized protein n=1 Tax=Trifolium subterraneum TaxID=3900 RepID=A0A2Z6PA66_TRISU|nr:hypothetical protein TSUD_239140 [Trifolium subterraneum]
MARLAMSIQHHSGREILNIHGCTKLEKRCQEEIGKDWPKIDHVQYIEIQSRGIQYFGCGGWSFEGDAGFSWSDL